MSDTQSLLCVCVFCLAEKILKNREKWIANCDIDFFVFRHRFYIESPNFPKFERVQNSAVKFWAVQKRKWEIVKLAKIGMKLLFTIA